MPEQIEFDRPAKYKVVKVLGRGACGETVQIRDHDMGCDFVAKKYHPFVSEDDVPSIFEDLLDRFRDEARILFQLNHPNVVRVFNFFDYREHKTSYIIMEFISGPDILEYLSHNPANADKVFEGVVDGFAHLQQRKILHRDIRPMNILVGENSVPKIIDFGFGKRMDFEESQIEKSISLNWWCDTPPEFQDGIYDFQTEVYFVGKLFQKAVEDCNLSDFKYMPLLRDMNEPDRESRAQSFSDIQRAIIEGKFLELAFSNTEIEVYRKFSSGVAGIVSSIQLDARFERDTSKLVGRLEALYRRTMLEEYLAAPNQLALIFVLGSFRYWKNARFEVATLRSFLDLLMGFSEEKRSIVVENLLMRLEAVERTEPPLFDDEIPF
ncbi:MAG: protein kinase [Rhodospirillales bacterium]|nr:protein kinase [Rhodospirillales bacterium]